MNRATDAKNIWPTRRFLILLGAGVFLFSALIAAPASLLAPALSAGGSAVQYREVSGSLWRGEISGLYFGEIYLGDVRYRLHPSALLTGALAADLETAEGAAIGRGRIRVSALSQSASIYRLKAEFDLSAIKRYSLFGIPYRGRIRADVKRLEISRRGCRVGAGEIWTDALNDSAQRLVGDGLLLAGPLSCDNGKLRIDLTGANREGVTQIAMAVTPDFAYQVSVTVTPDRPELGGNLQLLGFEEHGASLVYDAVGVLKGAGS